MHALLLLPLLLGGDPAPLMPTGSSSDFQASAYKIEQMLGEGKFEAAKPLIDRLAPKTVTIQWDDKAVPTELRADFAAARDAAIADWVKYLPDLKVLIGNRGNLKVSFTETLPPPAGAVRPAGAVFFASDALDEPRIEAVVALKRDTPPLSIDKRHVQNEVGYGIGALLGLGRLPRPIGYMGRMDTLSLLQLRVNKRELDLVRENWAFADALRDAASKKIALQPTKPSMYINPARLERKSSHQGDLEEFSLEVANRGNAPLLLSNFTECSCVHIDVPQRVEPGATGLVKVTVDTAQVIGHFEKSFVIFSNDPDQAERLVPVVLEVTPRYRLLKANPGAIVLDSKGSTTDLFLALDPERSFKVTGVKVQGINAAVDIQPWEGSMADPELNEGEKPRKGYKVAFLPSPTTRKGRLPVSFFFTTDNKDLPTIIETVYVQWGIVAQPQDLSLGEIPKARKEIHFYVSRPGKPFKILKVEAGLKSVQTSFEPFKNGDYRVTVVIQPTVNVGKLLDTVIVTTDDPDQPKLEVELQAVVK